MRVIGVIVTYQPEMELLKLLVSTLSCQVPAIIIVDNNSSQKIEPSDFDVQDGVDITVLKLYSNKGVAFAQNTGISKARALGGDAVLLLDQDSYPAEDMVTHLATRLLSYGDSKVAAVGPEIIDNRSLKKKRFMTGYGNCPRFFRDKQTSLSEEFDDVEVPYLISSGTLIPIAVLDDVGLMKDDYFIDRVDTEWCFRARARGYNLIGMPSAKLYHALGEAKPEVTFLKNTRIPWHQPFRHYYAFRNTILMLKQTKMPLLWKLHSVWRLTQVGLLNILLSNQRLSRLKFIWYGIIHGVRNVSGKLDTVAFTCEPISKVK